MHMRWQPRYTGLWPLCLSRALPPGGGMVAGWGLGGPGEGGREGERAMVYGWVGVCVGGGDLGEDEGEAEAECQAEVSG